MLNTNTKIFFLTLILINLIYAIVEIIKNKKSKGYVFPEDFYEEEKEINIDNFELHEIDERFLYEMDPRDFEIFVASIYRKLGYTAIVTQYENDGGKDIILSDKNDNKIYVECKRWNKNTGYKIGREICQKLIGAMSQAGIKKGIVITTGEVHENAYEYKNELEANTDIRLKIINIDGIINLVKKAKLIELKENTSFEKAAEC